MALAGHDATVIYDAIAIGDVQRAADTLAGAHAESRGRDGFVSLEVQPDLARDTDGTLASARSYWRRVAKPNGMIKIPGTPRASRPSRRRSTTGST
jgi:transaldolase